jgi:hypothetical protein
MEHAPREKRGLRRNLSVWQAVGPYPPSRPAHWLPMVAFGWVLVVAVLAIASPGMARRLSVGLARLDDDQDLARTD